jgi:quercetin dioxygenase-like cupin family protein
MELKITRWASSTLPTLSELQSQLLNEGLFPYDWSNSPGDIYTPHVHDYDKVIIVVRGSITWTLPQTAETFETRAGDRLDLPRGTWHTAEVGPHGVKCLEGQIV